MEIIRRSDYACRILRAAYRANGDYLSISTISEEEKIPYAFARNIQHVLLQIGYVKTRRGARGGLALSIDPAKVSMLDLMRALEVNINLAPCAGSPDVCENSDDCGFNRVWCAATGLLDRYFASLSLKDVIEGKVDVPVTD
ncbi:MAG: Rrf2 family transcriptional regulator, partial [Coriobacteriaceae bacterium]|nr:Rrf2 family transcriptional regulator [Coriobacteriaceae bacterium]